MFKESKVLFIISLVLISISFIYASCGVNDYGILSVPFIIGYVIFIVVFYKTKPTGLTYPWFFNPFTVGVTVSAFGLGVFVISTFVQQTSHVMEGFTTKQIFSIKKEYIKHIAKEEKIAKEYLRQKTCKERMINLKNFLMMKSVMSIIDSDRDL